MVDELSANAVPLAANVDTESLQLAFCDQRYTDVLGIKHSDHGLPRGGAAIEQLSTNKARMLRGVQNFLRAIVFIRPERNEFDRRRRHRIRVYR